MEYLHLPPADDGTEYATRRIRGEDYLTTGLFPVGSGKHTHVELVRCPTLALDFDLADWLHESLGEDSPGPKGLKALFLESPREEVEALLTEQLSDIGDILERCELQPTCVVMSGYGYHVYFHTACGGWDLDRMKEAGRWLVHIVNTAAGYPAADPGAKDAGTRVLRAPGTYNRKGPPVEVLLVSADGPNIRLPETLAVPANSPGLGRDSAPDGSTPFSGIQSATGIQRRSYGEVLLKGVHAQSYTTLRELVDAELGHEEGHRIRLQCPFHEGSSTDSAFLCRNDEGQPYLVCTSQADGKTYWDDDWVPPRQQRQVVAALQVTAQGGFRNNLHNAHAVLTLDTRWAGRLWYDARKYANRLDNRPTTDEDAHLLRIWIGEHYNFEPSRQLMFDVIDLVCSENPRNKLTEWLDSLTWDGIPRVDTWMEVSLDCEKSDYYKDVSRKFMISACARAYAPGCKVDTVLMLIGNQGIGKSTVLRELAGRQWFDDTEFNLNNKDAFTVLAGAWIYEVAELSSFKKAYAEKVKGFISSAKDVYRPPYKRSVAEFPRQTVIVATSNEATPLSDPTGSRRYWPVKVPEVVNIQWVKKNRDQLWAEAVEAYKAGEQWHQTRAMEAEQRRVAEEFTSADPYEGVLAKWLERPMAEDLFSLTDVRMKALGGTLTGDNRLARILRGLGAAPLKRNRSDGRLRLWLKPGVPLPEGREYHDVAGEMVHQDSLNKVLEFAPRLELD